MKYTGSIQQLIWLLLIVSKTMTAHFMVPFMPNQLKNITPQACSITNKTESAFIISLIPNKHDHKNFQPIDLKLYSDQSLLIIPRTPFIFKINDTNASFYIKPSNEQTCLCVKETATNNSVSPYSLTFLTKYDAYRQKIAPALAHILKDKMLSEHINITLHYYCYELCPRKKSSQSEQKTVSPFAIRLREGFIKEIRSIQ